MVVRGKWCGGGGVIFTFEGHSRKIVSDYAFLLLILLLSV